MIECIVHGIECISQVLAFYGNWVPPGALMAAYALQKNFIYPSMLWVFYWMCSMCVGTFEAFNKVYDPLGTLMLDCLQGI